MSDNLEEILTELELNRRARESADTDPLTASQEERREKVASFRLEMDLDGEFGEYEEPTVSTPVSETEHSEEEKTEETTEAVEATEPVPAKKVPQAAEPPKEKPAPQKEKNAKKRPRMDAKEREMLGCAGGIFYVLAILGVSLVLACLIIMAALDLTGLNKSGVDVRVTLEEGATTATVAQTLKEHGLIDHTFFFKLYSNLTGDDSEYRSGVYTLSANMGYGNIVDRLRAGVPRTVVSVTIPEGFTIDDIALLLEEKAVCTKGAFYDAVLTGDYSDYSFVASLPKEEGTYAGRGYALEGYMFPDTYEFYTGSTGETVVRKLLNNFDNRVDTTYKTTIAAMGMTVNDVVTLASIVQAEAGSDEWSRVARVLINRLNNAAEFPCLQCDATINYYKGLDLSVSGLTVDQNAYDTHVRKGLTPGAISNPGMKAIKAVLSPSEADDVKDCYYFATDLETGITYYSRTYAEHQAICAQYGI